MNKNHKNWEDILSLLFFCGLFVLYFSTTENFLDYINSHGGDVFHNTWTYNRNIKNILSFRNPFTPNIFFPDIYSSYYSEVSFGDTLIYGIVFLTTGSDVAGYAFLYFISTVLSALFSFKLARFLGASFYPALVAGVISSFCSYRYEHIAHVQLLSIFRLTVPLYFSFRYLVTGQKTCLYFLFLFLLLASDGPSYDFVTLVIVAPVIIVALFPVLKDDVIRKRFVIIGVLSIIALFANFPIWLTYLKLFATGKYRLPVEFKLYKNNLISFLIPPSTNALYGSIGNILENYFSLTTTKSAFIVHWFSGIIPLSFVLCSLKIFSINKLQTITKMKNRNSYIKALFFSACVLFLISLGRMIDFATILLLFNPIFWIFTQTPVLSAMRFIAHYAYPAIALFSIVSAVLVTQIKFFGLKKSKITRCSGLILGILMLIEMFPDHSKKQFSWKHKTNYSAPALYNFLRTLRQHAGTIFLPFPIPTTDNFGVSWHRQFDYMRYAHLHSLWLVNAISGFFPHEYRAAQKAFTKFPSNLAYQWIQNNNLRYLIIDKRSQYYKDSVNYVDIHKCSSFIHLYQDADYEVFEIKDNQHIFKCSPKSHLLEG